MDYFQLIKDIVWEVIISLVVIISLFIYRKKIKKWLKWFYSIGLANKLFANGLTLFHFSREDYKKRLSFFLDGAKSSIEIVSISLKITHEEGKLTDVFQRKLIANPDFFIRISLINPNNKSLVKIVADSLSVNSEKMRLEILDMLKDLKECKNSLEESQKLRFDILVHNCFPMGSAIMLDATPISGKIQIETKLYKAKRDESFGFLLSKKSSFFQRNYNSWSRILKESKPFK